MKKILTALMACLLVFGLVACGGTSDNKDGEVSVFYYTFSDTYISSVRSAMDKLLGDAGLNYQNYDANGNQTTQTEQVTTALSKGSRLLIVNVVDTGSNDAAENIIRLAKEKNVPVIFFNRSVEENVVSSYDKCGEYLVENFATADINGDGKISYVMFKGQEGNMEAIARTQYGVDDANAVLAANSKEALEFYDASNTNKYLVDQNGQWSSAAATDYMNTILSQCSEANGNMIELVIANNDDMALGAISALQAAGYNKEGGKVIPVFGVDATEAAKDAIKQGSMIGTIKQDADGMASTITAIGQNFLNEKSAFDGITADNVVGTWRVNIPYGVYTGE